MLEVELGAVIFGADDFDVVNKLFLDAHYPVGMDSTA